MLGHYLAGLIEGDGSIIVPKTLKNEKGKLLHPKVKITFVDKDSPLAKKLKEILGAGTIEYPRDANYRNFLVQDVHTLQKIAVLQSFHPLLSVGNPHRMGTGKKRFHHYE